MGKETRLRKNKLNMKKIYLLLLTAILYCTPVIKAQQPDVIYMATWSTMSELGSPVTPNDEDPELRYNPETQCYEGEIIDWPRLAVNPYIAKIPYSLENDVITYYGVVGPTQSFIFNTVDSQSFEFTSSKDSSLFKGFGLSLQNAESVVDVKVSMNLNTNLITFTKFESGEGQEIPAFISVDPENGGEINLEGKEEVIITLTFSGEVTTLEAVNNGSLMETASREDGTVWEVIIPSERLQESAVDSQGIFSLRIQKAYAGNMPVSFENGSPVLNLSYTISGLTKDASFKFTGTDEALKTLNVYKSPEYSVGDEVEIIDNELLFTYTNMVTYLFTVGNTYDIIVSSTVESNDGENWKLGKGYSTKKGPNGETTNEKVLEGVTLTLYEGSTGAEFTVAINPKEAGVESLNAEKEYKVYNSDGVHILTTKNLKDLRELSKGLYIVNDKKIMIK